MPSFSWSDYSAALVARGLPPADAKVLVRQARATLAPRRNGNDRQPLFEFMHERLSQHDRELLVDAVVEAQARGPQGSTWATAWRQLYVAGCPLDHIWCVLWHSFKDPDTECPEDWKRLPRGRALRNVERYIELQFPRSGAPHIYGPGLGCERLLANTRGGVRELVRLRAPATILLQSLNHCWSSVVSPGLRAHLDSVAGVTGRAVARPKDGPVNHALAKVRSGAALTPSEWGVLALVLKFRGNEKELLQLDDKEVEPVATHWLRALDDLFAAGQVVHDVSHDCFRLRGERVTRVPVCHRPSPRPPRRPPAELTALLRRWRQKEPLTTTTVAALGQQEPLRWVDTATEMAVHFDEATAQV